MIYLVSIGANVDHKDSDGATALMAATPDNHLPITALLIAAGQLHCYTGAIHALNVDPLDNDHSNCYILSARNTNRAWKEGDFHKHYVTIVFLMILSCHNIIGTDVNVQDVYGITALILASRYGHFDLVQSLLGAG